MGGNVIDARFSDLSASTSLQLMHSIRQPQIILSISSILIIVFRQKGKAAKKAARHQKIQPHCGQRPVIPWLCLTQAAQSLSSTLLRRQCLKWSCYGFLPINCLLKVTRPKKSLQFSL